MDYSTASEYISRSYSCGHKHSFAEYKEFCKYIGALPEKNRVIHVAGTNGKGSTCAMISSILINAGHKVGMFTSPHLVSYNERYRVNNTMISDEEFEKYVRIVSQKSEEFFKPGDMLSFFEILTSVCFLYFADMQVDFLVLETGMGGRLDSTNVIENPLISVICSVSFDHMRYLGDSLESIAMEKAGIIKKNSNLVLYLQSDIVYNVVRKVCEDKNTILWYSDSDELRVRESSLEQTIFSINNKYLCYDDIELKLHGDFQIKNATLVLLAVEAMRHLGVDIPEPAVYRGLASVVWPGRLEVVKRLPLTVVDGAHNEDAARVLAENIRLLPGKRKILLIAVFCDKEYSKIINLLADECDSVVITCPEYKDRAVGVAELYSCVVNKNKTIITENDYKRALMAAKKVTGEDGIIICAGSLYLAGDIRSYLELGGEACD